VDVDVRYVMDGVMVWKDNVCLELREVLLENPPGGWKLDALGMILH